MKTYFIFLCLLISGALASASTQTTANQDKPPYLYVKSYDLSDSGFFKTQSTTLTGTLTFSGGLHWSSGLSGFLWWTAFANDSLGDISLSVEDSDNLYCASNSLGTLVEVGNSSPPCNGCDYTNTYINQPMPIIWEHCDINFSTNYILTFGGLVNNQAQERRAASARIKLKTGGKATSKLRNLFGLSASAAQMNPPVNQDYAAPQEDDYYYMLYYHSPGTNIPAQTIAIGNYGNLLTNGVLYRILPDNADVDVTPYVAGVDYYTFNEPTPTKYHSCFEVFDEQANPGGILPTGANNVGHAFWRLTTEAPSDALQYISPALTNYLNHCWGFYPTNDSLAALFVLNGKLQNDDGTVGSADIKRKFYIGFPNLLTGLIFTKGIADAPPVYTLLVYDCVDAAIETAAQSGVKFANQQYGVNGFNGAPQYMAYYLAYRYPGPWLNNTNIFYP